jgi:iron complex outermembrane receptor protein
VARVLEFKVTDGTTVKDRLGWAAAPQMRGSLRNIWSHGDWSVNWNVNYIGDQRNPGVKPTFGFLAGDPGTHVGSYVTHDLALTYKAPWNAGITLGANNVGNRYPQLVETDGRPWNFNLYNAYGRILYLRYTQKF